MRKRLWLEAFVKAITERGEEIDASTDKSWTQGMGRVMDDVGEELNCYVVRRKEGEPNNDESGEYLNIDVMFFDKKDGDKSVLPVVVLEHENSYQRDKIEYSLWKILCVRAPLRILICYQGKTDTVEPLRKHLEDVIWEGSLMKGTDGDLVVMIGDDSKGEEAEWGEYINVYEWRNDRLKRVEALEW